jgi:hypothetical protein
MQFTILKQWNSYDIVVYCKESGQITSLQKMFLSDRKKIHIVISSQVLFHNGSLLHSQLNTQLLITVHNSSGNLTHV